MDHDNFEDWNGQAALRYDLEREITLGVPEEFSKSTAEANI